MERMEPKAGRASGLRRKLGATGLLGAGLIAGGVLAGSHIAGAASNTGTASTTASSSAATAAPRGNPATMTHGPGEALLTGSNAAKATAAAKAAVPGATVIRVETDSDGAAYEAHMRKADGGYVTVKMDRTFKVTGTEDGFGAGPRIGSGSGA